MKNFIWLKIGLTIILNKYGKITLIYFDILIYERKYISVYIIYPCMKLHSWYISETILYFRKKLFIVVYYINAFKNNLVE